MKAIRFFLTYIFLFCLVLISCGKKAETSDPSQEVQKDTVTTYGDISFTFPVLSENAKNYVSGWGAFDDFEKEVKSVNGSTSEALLGKTDRLVQRLDSLSKNIPDTISTQPITSRVMVATTRAKMLHQIVRKSRIDSIELQTGINELNFAARNLFIQINEKFQKDAIDLQKKEYEEKELEKQKRFLDSVFQAELKDKKEN